MPRIIPHTPMARSAKRGRNTAGAVLRERTPLPFSLIAAQLIIVGRLIGASIAAIIVLVFAASGYFLMVRQTTDFFKTFRASSSEAPDGEGDGR